MILTAKFGVLTKGLINEIALDLPSDGSRTVLLHVVISKFLVQNQLISQGQQARIALVKHF